MEPNLPSRTDLTKHTVAQEEPPKEGPVRTPEPPRDRLPSPARPAGPNASAIVFGLVAIVLAGLFIANESMSLSVDWSRLGPGAIIGLGVVMAVIGAVGLVRHHDDS